MTVSSTNNKHVYDGNGVTIYWPYTFSIIQSSDIKIYITDNNGNLSDPLESGYSVDTNNSRVLYPTVESGLPTLPFNYKITLLRAQDLTQELDLTRQGPLDSENLEKAYDKLTMMAQQHEEILNRCVKYGVDQNPTLEETTGFLETITIARDNAQASAAAAAASEIAAAVSETNAAQSSQDAIDAINTFVQGFFEKNEVPAGVVDGVNTDFDISLIPLNGVVRVSRNGLKVPEAEYTFNSPTVSFVIPPVRGQIIEVSYITNGQVINPVVSGLSFMPEYRTITNAEFLAKQLILGNAPATASDTIVDVIGGSPQRYGVDFTVSGNVLDWNGLGLDGQLLVGSIVRIEYFY